MAKTKNNKLNKNNRLLIVAVAFAIIGITSLVATLAAPMNTGKGKTTTSGNYSVYVANGTWNGTTTATIIGDLSTVKEPKVYIECFKPSFDGQKIFAAFYDVVNGSATVGPFYADGRNSNGGVPLWGSPEKADCKATVGYVTRDGWGKWTALGSTTFVVNAQ